MKLYLLRVGADKSNGFFSPIFEDCTYLFVPIPEDKNPPGNTMAKTYGSYDWKGKSVLEYIRSTISSEPTKQQLIHNDPEFKTFTYGSPKYNKDSKKDRNYEKLLNMEKGDIIVFYARFQGFNKDHPPTKNEKLNGLYFFAYIVVERIVSYSNHAVLSLHDKDSVAKNHHFLRNSENELIVVGNTTKSRLFNKAVLLSSSNPEQELEKTNRIGPNYYPCLSMQDRLAKYNKPLNLSPLREPFNDNSSEAVEFIQYLYSLDNE
jgi:putative DNA base modification enzyme with NMAD domain